jgi:hypothetical protein
VARTEPVERTIILARSGKPCLTWKAPPPESGDGFMWIKANTEPEGKEIYFTVS